MDTFTWLLVGHLVGDWVLQNEWMVLNKKRSWFHPAGLTHVAIYTLTTYGALWLSGWRDRPWPMCLALITLIFITHWLVDASQVVKHWMRFYRKGDLFMVEVMVDQTFHLVTLAGVTLLVAVL